MTNCLKISKNEKKKKNDALDPPAQRRQGIKIYGVSILYIFKQNINFIFRRFLKG